jgi:GPI ethanolamine phosphate transferase 3 subunit O
VVAFDEIVPLALLAQLAFFASGHQATIPSLQWKSAFVLTPTLSYPLAPLFMVLNTLGPTALVAFAAPLLGIWNLAPLLSTTTTTTTTTMTGPAAAAATAATAPPQKRRSAAQQQQQQERPEEEEEEQQDTTTASAITNPTSQARIALLGATRAALGTSLYFATLSLGNALSAAWLRRHLMVWKVFAPRYMMGAVELLLVDCVLIVAVWGGVGRVVSRIDRIFQLPVPVPDGGGDGGGGQTDGARGGPDQKRQSLQGVEGGGERSR